jgi:hypothetical protein
VTVVSKAIFARILTALITAVVLQQKALQMVVKLPLQGHISASVKMDILVITAATEFAPWAQAEKCALATVFATKRKRYASA